MPASSNNHFHLSITLSGKQAEKLPCDAADLLAAETGLSKQKIKSAMQQGAVWLHQGKNNKRLRKANTPLKAGEKIEIYYDENLLRSAPADALLIKDEGAYSIWYKPYGMLSQGSLWGDSHAINRYAELNLKPQRPAFVVHRLDREAQGLMLLAHNKKVAAQLSKLFQERSVTKYYRVLVQGDFGKQSLTLNKNLDGKAAVSIVEPLIYRPELNQSLLSVKIETGRKHQIRRHLADYGFPVMGDSLYGSSKPGKKEMLLLCSVVLSFVCPIDKRVKQFSLLDKTPDNLPDELESMLIIQA